MGVVCLIIKVTGKLQIYGPLKKKKRFDSNYTLTILCKRFFLVQYHIVPFVLIPKKIKLLIHSENINHLLCLT